MSGTEERRKSARQRRVRPSAHSSALESLRAARDGLERRVEQQEVSQELLNFHPHQLRQFTFYISELHFQCGSTAVDVQSIPWGKMTGFVCVVAASIRLAVATHAATDVARPSACSLEIALSVFASACIRWVLAAVWPELPPKENTRPSGQKFKMAQFKYFALQSFVSLKPRCVRQVDMISYYATSCCCAARTAQPIQASDMNKRRYN